jgi:hypothetical protein
MSYLQTSGFWDGGSGSSGTTADKGAGRPDIIKLWVGSKMELAQKYGVYKYADGKTVYIDGRAQPQLNFGQVTDLFASWGKIGGQLAQKVMAAGKSISGINKATANFLVRKADWTNWVIDKYEQTNGYQGRYLFMPATDKAMEILANYVVELDTGMWSGYNIEADWERMRDALPSWLRPIFDVGFNVGKAWDKGACSAAIVKDICDASSFTLKILKWGAIATVGAVALWGISVATKKRTHV